jgi:hypothetical protein
VYLVVCGNTKTADSLLLVCRNSDVVCSVDLLRANKTAHWADWGDRKKEDEMGEE